jgi:hypothetical protein
MIEYDENPSSDLLVEIKETKDVMQEHQSNPSSHQLDNTFNTHLMKGEAPTLSFSKFKM